MPIITSRPGLAADMARKPMPRGGELDSKHPAGKLMPVINAERCEGAGPCMDVCPVDVFEMREPTEAERDALSWKARVKVWVHGGQQAFVIRAQDCRGCGLCVTACPEKAITLARYTPH
jgi:4Fe-4S ferredoxin